MALAATALATAALAFAVSMHTPGCFGFLFDAARHHEVALGIAQGRELPLHGHGIGGTPLFLGPLSYYLTALPLAFVPSVTATAAWVSLLFAGAAGGLVVFAWRRVHPVAGALAGAAFVLNPRIPMLVFDLDNSSYLHPFAMLVLATTAHAAARPTPGPALGCGVAVGLASQCHLTALGFAIAFPLVARLLGHRPGWRVDVAYLGGIVATYATWIVDQLASGLPAIADGRQAIGGGPAVGDHVGSLAFLELTYRIAFEPTRFLVVAAALGGVASVVPCLRRRYRDAPIATPWVIAGATAAALALGELLFVLVVARRSAFFSEHYFHAAVVPSTLLGALACALPWQLPGAHRALRAAGTFAGAALALAVLPTTFAGAVDRCGEAPSRVDRFVSLHRHARAHGLGAPDTTVAVVGGVPSWNVRHAVLQLDALDRARGAAPPGSQGAAVLVFEGASCDPARPDSAGNEAVVIPFASCEAFERWLVGERRRCAVNRAELPVELRPEEGGRCDRAGVHSG